MATEPLSRSRLSAPEILKARILDVDIGSYTVTVATEVGKKIFSDIASSSGIELVSEVRRVGFGTEGS